MIESRPKTNWVEKYSLVGCTVVLRANMVETCLPSHGFLSSNDMFCILKVHRILPIVWCTLSNNVFAWGFLVVIGGLTFMP